MTMRALSFPLVVILLLTAAACDSETPDRSDAAEDGGSRGPDAGDGDAGDGDGDGDSGVDERDDAGPGDGGSVEPGETLVLASYCQQVSALYYEYLQTCYGSEPYPESERDERVEAYRARCMQAEAAVDDGRVAYDEARAHACVENMKLGGCARQFGESQCEGVFRGLVELGGDCYVEETLIFMVGVSACIDGFCDEDGTCPGTCMALPERDEACDEGRCRAEDYCDDENRCRARKSGGDGCVSEIECTNGLKCSSVDDELQCQPGVFREGEACSESAPCGGLATCLGGECTFERELGDPCTLHSQCPEDARCLMSECAEPMGEGDACANDQDCEAPLVCNTSLEEPECIALPIVGEACVNGRCEDGASCRHDVDDGDGTCRAQIGQGESCLVAEFPVEERCEEGLHCVEDGTCELPGDLGDPCGVFTIESCNEGLWCSRETYTCEAPAEEDEACNPVWGVTCAEGLGCACGLEDAAQCSTYAREPVATDTCQPLIESDGECFRAAECSSGMCMIDFAGPSAEPGTCFENAPLCLP